eukprot:gene1938-1446_t
MTSVLLLGSTGGTGNILRLLRLKQSTKTLTSDYSSISEALKKFRFIDVEYILHTSASNFSSKQTEQFIGFEGMKNIIQFAKKSKKLKKIIYVTSGKVTRPFHPISKLKTISIEIIETIPNDKKEL